MSKKKFDYFYRVFLSQPSKYLHEIIMLGSHCALRSLNFGVLSFLRYFAFIFCGAKPMAPGNSRTFKSPVNTQPNAQERHMDGKKAKEKNKNNNSKKMCQAHKVNNLIHFRSRVGLNVSLLARERSHTREIIALKPRCDFHFRIFENETLFCFFFFLLWRALRYANRSILFWYLTRERVSWTNWSENWLLYVFVARCIGLHMFNPPSAIIRPVTTCGHMPSESCLRKRLWRHDANMITHKIVGNKLMHSLIHENKKNIIEIMIFCAVSDQIGRSMDVSIPSHRNTTYDMQ